MSAQAGWYPDPGGGDDLYRYWDGKAWSAATSPNPAAPAPSLGLVNPSASAGQPFGGPAATSGYANQSYSSTRPQGYGSAYATYQQRPQRRTPWGWWLAGGALVLVIVVIAVLAVRATTGLGTSTVPPGGGSSPNLCPQPKKQSIEPGSDPNDGQVHGGPVSYPELGSPWGTPQTDDDRVPFGTDVRVQSVTDQDNYDGNGHSWVASILVAELQAGDGFFSPEDGSKIVVKCILGTFYGNAAVTSDVVVDQKATIDGHDGWIVESKLHFDIPKLNAKGERLIVAIVSAGARSGLYYASIPDTKPELLAPARAALAQLKVTE